MGLLDFISKAKTIIDNSNETQIKFSHAQDLAKRKRLKEAIKLAEEITQLWSEKLSWNEDIIRNFSLGNFCLEVEQKLGEWKMILQRAEHCVSQAQTVLKDDKNNPFESQLIASALSLYQQCNRLIYETEYAVMEQLLEDKLQRRQNFQLFYQQGKQQGEEGFYQKGLESLLKAEKLFYLKELQNKIEDYRIKIKDEIQYEQELKQVQNLAQKGDFNSAYNLLKSSLERFTRDDGVTILRKLECVISAKAEYSHGLLAEKAGKFEIAKEQYHLALFHLPELESARYRLIIINLKLGNYSDVLESLDNLNNLDKETASYLRGFVYAQQNKWQEADKQWHYLTQPEVKTQRELLKTLAQINRLQIIQNIENLVSQEKYQKALNYCQELQEQFGIDSQIERNINSHIQPALQYQLWQSQNWDYIISELKSSFHQEPNITTLHNLAIAYYYGVQINEDYLPEWIVCWGTALANLPANPIFNNLPWLSVHQINYEQTKEELRKILENAIDKYKDNNLAKYYQLRDIYRCEILSIELMSKLPQSKVKIEDILITPGFYQQHQKQLQKISLSLSNLGALYTDWGLAVAACLQNDPERGLKIKPSYLPISSIEKFAHSLVNYYEGCYYLQHYHWKKATSPLKEVKSNFNTNQEWSQEINRLCEKQRQQIEEHKEHLEFAQWWYNLLKSPASASYLAEYKAREIAQQVADSKISVSTAINNLKELQQIDGQNYLVLDLLERLKLSQEAEEIDRLLKQGEFERAIQKAKYSSNPEIRRLVAQICLEIVIKGIQKPYLTYEEKLALNDLTHWAYELCPNDPEFLPLYYLLKIIS
jgi:tetratricopeptide (TPR) repeat protein